MLIPCPLDHFSTSKSDPRYQIELTDTDNILESTPWNHRDLHKTQLDLDDLKPLPDWAKAAIIAGLKLYIDDSPESHRGSFGYYNKVLEEGIRVCILYNLEKIACHLVPKCTKISIFIIHRAGEIGFLHLLKSISDYKIPIACSRILTTVTTRFLRIINKSLSKPRFAPGNYIQPKDVLHWACVYGGESTAREVLTWGLPLSNESIIDVFLNEHQISLLESLIITEQKVTLSIESTLSILAYKETELLLNTLKVLIT